MIRIDAVWLATSPLDMRAGTDTALARVVQVFGAAQPHHAYCFANARATRMKVLEGTRLTEWCVRWTFVKLSREIGLQGSDDSRGPRLHVIAWRPLRC